MFILTCNILCAQVNVCGIVVRYMIHVPPHTVRKSSERLLLLHLLFAEFERVLGSEDHTMESCDLRLESISMPELIR